MQAYEHIAIPTALQPLKVLEQFLDDVYFILKRTHFFYHINNFHQNIKLTIKRESNAELTFLDYLLKQNKENLCTGI